MRLPKGCSANDSVRFALALIHEGISHKGRLSKQGPCKPCVPFIRLNVGVRIACKLQKNLDPWLVVPSGNRANGLDPSRHFMERRGLEHLPRIFCLRKRDSHASRGLNPLPRDVTRIGVQHGGDHCNVVVGPPSPWLYPP